MSAVLPEPGRRAAVLLRLLAGALVVALVAAVVDFRELWRHLSGASPAWFVAALAVAVTGSCTAALRWSRIARGAGLRLSDRHALLFHFRGITVNTLLPGATVGGDAMRAAQASRIGNAVLPALFSVLLDRLAGLWSQALLSLAALALLAPGGTGGLGTVPRWLLAGYAGLLAVLVVAPWLPLARLPLGRVGGPLAAAAARGHELASGWDRYRRERGRELWPIAGLGLGVALLYTTAFWLCLRAVGLEVSWPVTVAVAAAIFIAGSIPVAIAGFGPREVGAAAAFAVIGAGAAPATAAAVLYGLAGTAQGIAAAPLFSVRAGLARGSGR
jgi:uncharacterized membrane protein YbhN (UPF0104 family)